jgi:hypothetical protein
LCSLSQLPGIRSFAFADDLAVGSRLFGSLHGAMRGIDSFKVLSGLGQNMDKTVVISSHDSLTCLRRRVRLSPWPQLAVRDRYTCLGIPVGKVKLTLNGVYEGARLLDKMEARCAAWSRAFSVCANYGWQNQLHDDVLKGLPHDYEQVKSNLEMKTLRIVEPRPTKDPWFW